MVKNVSFFLLAVVGIAALGAMVALTISLRSQVAAEPLVGVSVNKLSQDTPNPLGTETSSVTLRQAADHPVLTTAIEEVNKRHNSPYPYAAAFEGKMTLAQATALRNAFSFTETTDRTQGHESYFGVLEINGERYMVLLIFS